MANGHNRNRVRILVLREARLSVRVLLPSRRPITEVYVIGRYYCPPDITSVIRRRGIYSATRGGQVMSSRHTRCRFPREKKKSLCCARLLARGVLRDALCGRY